MSVSFVGEADASATSVGLPLGTLPGDLILGIAYRNASTTPPSANANYTDLLTATGANTNSIRVVARVAVVGDTTFGAFANATDVECVVLRGQKGASVAAAIGANTEGGSNASPVTIPSLSLTDTDGSSWVLAFVGAKGTGTNSITITGPPAMTKLSGSDTNLGVWAAEGISSFGGVTTDSQPSGSNVYRSAAVEVLAAAGGTTFTDSQSGTETLTGSVTELSRRTDATAGTLTLTGSKTEAFRYTDTMAGSLALTGTGVDSYTPPGGATTVPTRMLMGVGA